MSSTPHQAPRGREKTPQPCDGPTMSPLLVIHIIHPMKDMTNSRWRVLPWPPSRSQQSGHSLKSVHVGGGAPFKQHPSVGLGIRLALWDVPCSQCAVQAMVAMDSVLYCVTLTPAISYMVSFTPVSSFSVCVLFCKCSTFRNPTFLRVTTFKPRGGSKSLVDTAAIHDRFCAPSIHPIIHPIVRQLYIQIYTQFP